MLRDRLRHWECKKNVRRSGGSYPRVKAPRGYGNNKQSGREDNDHLTYGELVSLFKSARASLYNPLHIPKEEESLRQTLKSVLDWQLHVGETGQGFDLMSSDARQFLQQLNRMSAALDHIRRGTISTAIAIRALHETSLELEDSFNTRCTPLAMLLSIDIIVRLRETGPSQQICAATSNFLLNKATEALHPSNPALLLMRQMFLCARIPEGLAMIHEVGCVIINLTSQPIFLFEFRADFIYATHVLGMGATFRPYVDTLTEMINEKHIDDGTSLLKLADLHYQHGLFDECVQLAQRCLDVLKSQGREISWQTCWAWSYMASTRAAQGDFFSEEAALRTALTVAELIEPDIASGSGESHLYVSETIFYLHECCRVQNKQDECEALRLQYPHVFAED